MYIMQQKNLIRRERNLLSLWEVVRDQICCEFLLFHQFVHPDQQTWVLWVSRFSPPLKRCKNVIRWHWKITRTSFREQWWTRWRIFRYNALKSVDRDMLRGSGGHSADPEGSHVDCVVLQVSSPDLHLLVSGNVTGSRPLPTNIRVLARAAIYSGLPRAERAQHPKHSCRIELSEFSHKLQITRGKFLFVVFESQHWSLF